MGHVVWIKIVWYGNTFVEIAKFDFIDFEYKLNLYYVGR